MSAIPIIFAAVVATSPGLAEPTDLQWRDCTDGKPAVRLEICTSIVTSLEYSRVSRAYAAASLGDLHLAQNRLNEALSEYSRAIRLSPQYGYPHRRRAFVQFLLARPEDALIDYDLAVELSPLDPYAFIARASFYRQTGMFDQARADIEKALKLELDNSDLYFERGLLSLDIKDYAQAELDFLKTLQLSPDELDARYNLVNALRHQSRKQEALTHINVYLEKATQDPQGYRLRGWLRLDLGKFDDAYTDFQTATKMRPDDLTLQYALGYVHWRRGDFDRAIERYSAAEPEYETTGYFFYERGYARYILDQDRLALDDANRALEINPDDVDSLWLKGAVLLYLEDFPQAISVLNHAAKIDRDNADILIMRGRVQIAQEHFFAAVGDLTRAVELAPQNISAKAYRSYAAGLAGSVGLAKRLLDELIEAHPDAVLPYELSARLLYKKEDYEAARHYTQHLLKVRPEQTSYQVLHADIILELKQYAEAHRIYRAAIDGEAEPPAGWLRLGAYSAFHSQAREEAYELLLRAKSADPDDIWTSVMLADEWLERSEFDKAAEAFEQAIAATDDEDDLFSYRLGKAKADAGAGRYREALKMLTVLAKQQPDNTDVTWERANTLLQLGQQDEAIAEFENFRRRKPASLEAHYKLIEIMTAAGRQDEALELADRAVRLDREEDAGYRARAGVYLAMENFEAARRDIESALKVEPEDAGLHALRATAYLGSGAMDSALKSARRSVELAPQSVPNRLLLARLLIAADDAAAALPVLKAVIASDENAAEAHNLKAKAHKALGQTADAQAELEAARRLDALRSSGSSAGLR